MKNLLITFFIFGLIYFVSFYKRPIEDFKFFDRTHTTYIKGFAILLVILSHMGGRFGIRYLTPLGGTGVAMFLVCTGYGLSESYKGKGLTNYWQNKISKVWFPYFLIQSIAALFLSYSFFDYIKDVLLLEYNHPFGWYMQFLFMWYIVFYVINKINFLSPQCKYILFGLISLLIIFLPNQLWAEQAFSLFGGMVLSYKKDTLKIKDNRFVPFILLSIGVFLLATKQIDVVRNLPWLLSNINQLLIKLPLAIGLCLTVFQFQALFKNNMFKYIGKLSFPLYLIHAYTIDILENPTFLNILIFLTATFALSLLFNKTLKICYSINPSIVKAPI